MITVEVNTSNEYNMSNQHVYQWDKGEQLTISGVTCDNTPVVHFANKRSKKAIVISATVSGDTVTASIPNSLLQEPYPIIAYLYTYDSNSGKTVTIIEIPLIARTQPDDYVFSGDDGYITLAEINSKVDNMKKEMKSYVDGIVDSAKLGNADTLDNKHADSFSQNFGIFGSGDIKDIALEHKSGYAIVTKNVTGMPIASSNWFVQFEAPNDNSRYRRIVAHQITSKSSEMSYVLIHISDYNSSTGEYNESWIGWKDLNITIPTTLPANGGNADTVDGKHANEFYNSNMVINPNFKINQQGKTTYNSGENAVDGWKINRGTLTVNDGSITIEKLSTETSCEFLQTHSYSFSELSGKKITISFEDGAGNVYSATGTIPTTQPTSTTTILSVYNDTRKVNANISWSVNGFFYTRFLISETSAVTLKWIKVEIGTLATPFIPPNLENELIKIQMKNNTIHAKTADTAGTLAKTASKVCLRNISFGTAEPQVTNPNASGYVAEGALYGQYE